MAMWVRGNVTDLTPSRLSMMRTTVGTQTIINGMCQDIDKHNAILDSYANNENGHG